MLSKSVEKKKEFYLFYFFYRGLELLRLLNDVLEILVIRGQLQRDSYDRDQPVEVDELSNLPDEKSVNSSVFLGNPTDAPEHDFGNVRRRCRRDFYFDLCGLYNYLSI